MSCSTISMKSRWLSLSLLLAIAACSKDEKAATNAAATPATPAPAVAAPAVSAQVQAMSADQLRAAASKALSDPGKGCSM